MLEEFSFKFLGQEFDHGRHPEPKMPVYLWFLHAENDEELLTASSEPMDESVRHSGCVGDGASAGEQTWLDSSTNAKKRKMSSAQAASDLGDATVNKVVTAMTGMIGGSKTPGDPVIVDLEKKQMDLEAQVNKTNVTLSYLRVDGQTITDAWMNLMQMQMKIEDDDGMAPDRKASRLQAMKPRVEANEESQKAQDAQIASVEKQLLSTQEALEEITRQLQEARTDKKRVNEAQAAAARDRQNLKGLARVPRLNSSASPAPASDGQASGSRGQPVAKENSANKGASSAQRAARASTPSRKESEKAQSTTSSATGTPAATPRMIVCVCVARICNAYYCMSNAHLPVQASKQRQLVLAT